MSYDLIRHAYYSLDHPEGKSLSVQSPLYRLKTQIAERYLGESLEVYTNTIVKQKSLPFFIFHYCEGRFHIQFYIVLVETFNENRLVQLY